METNTLYPVNVAHKSPAVGSKCYVAGWGVSHGLAEMSDRLQMAEMKALSHNECIETFEIILPDGMICAIAKMGENVCKVRICFNYSCGFFFK